jgi:hypothetical protein
MRLLLKNKFLLIFTLLLLSIEVTAQDIPDPMVPYRLGIFLLSFIIGLCSLGNGPITKIQKMYSNFTEH